MKVNISQLLATLTIILTVSVVNNVSAQEGSTLNEIPELSPNYPDQMLREEKPLLYEPDGKSSVQKEQPVINQATFKTKGKNSEPSKSTNSKTEEDALSFNFLYYIIQKFKISDIVDQ
jgi:hypothetical protein